MKALVRRVMLEEDGASLVEYGLLVALIAIVAMAGASTLGGNLNTLFTTAASSI